MKKGNYSHFIKPLLILLDLLILNGVFFFVETPEFLTKEFFIYINLVWLVLVFFNEFYYIKRSTSGLKVFSLLVSQFFSFSFAFLAYFTLFKEGVVVHNQFVVLGSIIGIVSFTKFLSFYALKVYRSLGRNFRRVVVIGNDKPSRTITQFFNQNDNYGYRYLGYFSDNSNTESSLGTVSEVREFVLANEVDGIYCSIEEINKQTRKDLIWFCKANGIAFNLLPGSQDIYTNNLKLEFYEVNPVLKIDKLPFEKFEVRFVKRLFDISFSLIVILFVLSWLYPILWVLIKIESRGKVLFKQKREGLNGKDFNCYKFRSMVVNLDSDVKSAQKNDARITKIGAFLRKTSIDELPQFFNVFIGDMSVVGPRPHMTKQSQGFEQKINNYYKRNAVKPGITGLAQVSGYRGEIVTPADIENRIRLDVFYIEKWSFLLDIKIIVKTFTNVLVGEEKAY